MLIQFGLMGSNTAASFLLGEDRASPFPNLSCGSLNKITNTLFFLETQNLRQTSRLKSCQ